MKEKFNCAYMDIIPTLNLISHPENPNHHPQKQIDRLAELIEYQGQRSPIVISTRTGYIVSGHGRARAIMKLGWSKVAVDYQDFESDEQEYAHLTADNAISQWSSLDLGKINESFLTLGPELKPEHLGIKGFTICPSEKFDLEKELEEEKVEVSGIKEGVKRAIQIEFELNHYDRARDAVTKLRALKKPLGLMVLHFLEEKVEEFTA